MEMKTVKLGEIAEFANGLNFDKAAYRAGVKIIGVSDFKDYTTPVIDDLTEVAVDSVKESARLKENDIIFVRSNGNKDLVGRCMIIPHTSEKLYFSGFCIRCRFKNTVYANPQYFLYLFKSPSFRRQLSNTSVGANIQNLSQSRLAMVSVPLPPRAVQDRISSILTAYDLMIENCKRQIALLEESAQRIYREWFVDLRFPGHESTPIGENGLTEGWEYGTISSLGIFTRGKNLLTKNAHGGYIPVIAGGLTPSCFHDVSNTSYPVITVSGSGANAGYAALHTSPVWASDCSFLDSESSEDIYYIYCFLKNNLNILLSKQKGSAQPHVYARDINETPILIPDRHILKAFSNLISRYFNEIGILNNILIRSNEAKNLILPRLISGQIEINA